MTVTLELWHLILLLIAFFGAIYSLGRLLLAQIDKRLEARFTAQEQMRTQSSKHWDEKFLRVERTAAETDKSLMAMKLHVSENYVRREDHVRSQTVIEAKLDALASKFESLLLRGGALKEIP